MENHSGGRGGSTRGADRGGSGRGRAARGAYRGGSGRSSTGAYAGSGRLLLDAVSRTNDLPSRGNWRAPPSTIHSVRGGLRGREFPAPNSMSQQRQDNHRKLNFGNIMKLTDDNVQPSKVIRCLGDPENDLALQLQENLSNVDYLELIIVALGGFCKNSGASQFTNGFITVVKILSAQKIFALIPTMIINIPTSRASNLPAKDERLKRLITNIFHLATDMLVMAPAFACHSLGQNFFLDIISLKNMPSIRNLNNVTEVFDVLEGGIQLLETAWNQHIPAVVEKDDRRSRREKYLEELILQDPPDDFRTLNVIPNWDDVCMDIEPFLRPSIVKGKYPDIATYLDIQFRLLREDFFNPLRLGLLAYKNQTDKKKQWMRNPDNIRLYYGVEILEYDMRGDFYMIAFSNSGLRRINWEHSKRFIYGSLLCLSSDNFMSFQLFTVLDRNPKLLQEGKIKVKHEGDTLSAAIRNQTFIMAESTVFFESYRSILTALQRISPTNFPLKDYILGHNTSPEVPVYLNDPRVRYDLTRTCMQLPGDNKVEDLLEVEIRHDQVNGAEMTDDHGDGISRKIIVSTVNDPVGTILKKLFVRFSVLAAQRQMFRMQRISILDPNLRPDADELGLDPSQCAALYAALTQKISVIQGPPGTGKTYLGLRIVQTLLKNKNYWRDTKRTVVERGGERYAQSSPILVICYTNHALDQFLEGISKFTTSIVRIGSQSKCAALEPFSLMAWKTRHRDFQVRDTRRWISEITEKLNHFYKEQNSIRGVMLVMQSRGLIHEDSLLSMEVIPKSVHDAFKASMNSVRYGAGNWRCGEVMGSWLGIFNNEVLQKLADFFNKNSDEKTRAKKRSHEALLVKENDAADEWDKEYINEIQSDRQIEGDEHLALIEALKYDRHASNEEDEALNKVFVKFSYKISQDETLIKEFRESMEKVEGEDAFWYALNIREVQHRVLLLRQLLQIVPTLDDEQLDGWYKCDLVRIPLEIRWMMYNSWKGKALNFQEKRAAKFEELYFQNSNRLKDVRTLESAEICQNADIVGFTTTGAAKQRALLNHLKPKIVIVEEAAEVLEAHVVCALSGACQQLILIGDHQQLRPSVAVHRLAKEFFLDVSLFERLIKNGMEPCILGVQHRMRPEIARLIVPTIYPTLENHHSVLKYPSVRGLTSNIFFLTHSEQEVADHEGKSHLNPYEAQLSLALATHLIMQGYAPNQITILTTYSGQLLYFFKIRREQPAVQSVRISVVDNFQGEENDIIILSLVRSNEDENIGFLRIENRICVAVSRAKQGFYMIGNMPNLQGKSKLWNSISKVLDSNGHLGPDFVLKCAIHDVITKARKVTEFPPEGGCMEKCNATMGCGHICPRICHASDREHVVFQCQEKCSRFCPVGHPCPKKCFADCKPCMEQVIKKLPCTHEQRVLCHKDPAKEFCQTSVWKILPVCGHGADLQCGLPVAEAACPERCGMTLDCGHVCLLPCHKRSSHDQVTCRKRCRRKCPEQHPCDKMCFEDCGQCHIKMTKTLPCGHESEVECSQPVEDVDCNVKVQKTLENCNHSIEIECGKSTDGYKCKQPCEKMLCGDGHLCKKLCFQPCGRCSVRMERLLKCGHSAVVECYVDPLKIRCRVKIEDCLLPLCGHRVALHCGKDPYLATCSFSCNVRLGCGHSCTLRCHPQQDADHQEYRCKKPCGKMKQGCKKRHKCAKKCFEVCAFCNEKWNRHLPCGHTFYTECHRNDEDISCMQTVTKIIPECGHQVQLACSTEPTRRLCKQACGLMLPCGHACKKECCKPCSQHDCNEPVTTSQINICGHHVVLDCKSFHEVGGIPTETQMQLHLRTCSKPCGAMLDCMHQCNGTCGECFNGRVHRACDDKCGRPLVCGHNCDVNCGISCPPCRRTCEYLCSHSECRHKCCEPCSPCQEPCQWKCEHKACGKKCGERCDRTRCNEPCKKQLPCGHSCVGLCGEICPPLCRVCDKEKLIEFSLLFNEEDDDARFVFLPECEHCIEVEGMDHWMATDGDGQIQPKCCPRCKTIVRTCMPYGNIIKSTLDDITKAKRKILQLKGNPMEFFKRADMQMKKCRGLVVECQSLGNPIVTVISQTLDKIDLQLKPKKNGKGKKINPTIGTDIRYQIEVNLSFLKRVLEIIGKTVSEPNNSGTIRGGLAVQVGSTKTSTVTHMSSDLVEEFRTHVLYLLRSVLERPRISIAEYRTVTCELDRLEYVQAYFVLKSAPQFLVSGTASPENELIQRLLIKNVRVLEDGQEVEIRNALETLRTKLRTGLGISDKERQEIVMAVGLSRGHWYKCPNGHIYAIGDCGGAMTESRCNECNAVIGGGNHRLRQDNAFAPEMGAAHPAWPT